MALIVSNTQDLVLRAGLCAASKDLKYIALSSEVGYWWSQLTAGRYFWAVRSGGDCLKYQGSSKSLWREGVGTSSRSRALPTFFTQTPQPLSSSIILRCCIPLRTLETRSIENILLSDINHQRVLSQLQKMLLVPCPCCQCVPDS